MVTGPPCLTDATERVVKVCGSVEDVCVLHTLHRAHDKTERLTAIDKRPTNGWVWVDHDGLAADRRMDQRHHGGPGQAVYAYSREEAARWAGELGIDVPPGGFGENLATRGIAVSDAVIGERWAVGTHLILEVSGPRIPCRAFGHWMGQDGWVRRFMDRGDVGCYLRVVRPGAIRAGDPITVIERPVSGRTVRSCLQIHQREETT